MGVDVIVGSAVWLGVAVFVGGACVAVSMIAVPASGGSVGAMGCRAADAHPPSVTLKISAAVRVVYRCIVGESAYLTFFPVYRLIPYDSPRKYA